MNLIESVKLAITSLRANLMRSLLTMLGIIIGITSVIAIMTVGDGLANSVNSSMSDIGASNITLFIGQKDTDSISVIPEMTDEDMLDDEKLLDFETEFTDEIESIGLSTTVDGGTVSLKNEDSNISIIGVNADYIDTQNLEMIAGRSIGQKDIDGARNVAVISDIVLENQFDNNAEKAIGSDVSITGYSNNYDYTIVGVYKYEAQVFMGFGNSDNPQTNIYIPISTAQYDSGTSLVYPQAEVKTKNGVDGTKFVEDVQEYFDKVYRTNQYYSVQVFSLGSMMAQLNTMMSTISLALSVIAGISLLVGGIGVMNIMLVSVSERTKEIGTRKALGATNNNIRLQFVTESIIVCLIGGFIGIVLGGILGYIGSNLIGAASYPSLESILIAFGFSLAIGVFFGYYPASRAAQLNPIEALRYE